MHTATPLPMPLTKLSASGIARCADMMAPPPILASRERGRGRLPETIQARVSQSQAGVLELDG